MSSELKKPTEIKSKEEITGRKVLVYMNMASISPPIELHAAIMRDLIKQGNEVIPYVCDRSFSSSMENPFNRASIEYFKMFRAKDAVKNLAVDLRVIHLENVSDVVPEKVAAVLELAVMSSFASLLKAQSKKELSKKWLTAYDNMFRNAKKLYNFFLAEIEKEKCDFVCMYNGRFGDVRPALEAARDAGVGFILTELKRTTLEVVFVNELVHSIQGNTKRALASYTQDPRRAEELAREFFEKKVSNKPTGDPVFTKKQTRGSLPDAVVHTTKKVVAIYPTTDDEYKFIGKEWDGTVPEDQVKEIEKLAEALPESEYLLVVKMHPNQQYTADDTIGRYMHLAQKYSHIVVEKPLSAKDTYALMVRADIVVVFASTVGVEASYARKPVVLIGDTTWGNLDIAYKVYSGEEAAELITKGMTPKPILGSIIWGNYCMAYEDDLPEFKIIGEGNYFVGGKRIGKSMSLRILQLPAKTELMIARPGFKLGGAFFVKIINAVVNIMKGKWAVE